MIVERDLFGFRLKHTLAFCLDAGKSKILLAAGIMITGIAIADWAVGLDISLGILYIVPMVLAALALKPRAIVVLAVICATLRRLFENPHSGLEITLRFAFATVAYASAGLIIVAVIRSREEQALRLHAEEQLKTLVESSPAGILTLDSHGTVLAANKALNDLIGLAAGETMNGKPIEPYLPVLADALRLDTGKAPFRTSAQSQGRRDNGEVFLADTWFSTYPTADGPRLAAIVIDSSEDMREREEQNLRQLSLSSRILAGAMLHEMRNLCSAISLVYTNLINKTISEGRHELQGLGHLIEGLARIASRELMSKESEALEAVSLKEVLNDLKIVAEPSWSEAGAIIQWILPQELPRVLADRHGLLQVFLNLVQNSQRAVQNSPSRELAISVSASADKASVQFRDTGCGVSDPQNLFQPFQPGADSTGLGLYISRSLLRSYGGDLRFEPEPPGACFLVELLRVESRKNGYD